MPPLAAVLLLLLGPLYSVDLRTNIPGTPTDYSTANWQDFLTEPGNPFRGRFFYSMEITLLVSIAATAAAYPLAYYLAFHARRFRYPLLLLLIAPFFTSYLLRIVAWSDVMLNDNGVVNQVSLPGVIAAFVFVLIPTTGEFIAPLYVGGPANQLFGNEIQSFFGDSPNWNYGAVLALALIAVVMVLTVVFGRFLDTDLRAQAPEAAR